MGYQDSMLKLRGRMGGLSFSKTKRGYMVRKATGIDGKRLKKDASFERIRWTMVEFTVCAVATSKIKSGINYQTSSVKDGGFHNRLMSTLIRIKNMDITHPRGLRTVMGGLKNEAACAPLNHFSLNIASNMRSKLQADLEIDTMTGRIVLKNFNPIRQLIRPKACEVVGLQSIWLQLDLDGDYRDRVKSKEVFLAIDSRTSDLEIPLERVLSKKGLNLLFLQLRYYDKDELGGLIPYHDANWNPWSIVEVWMTQKEAENDAIESN